MRDKNLEKYMAPQKIAWLCVIRLFLSAHKRPLLERSRMSGSTTQKLDAAFLKRLCSYSMFSRRMAIVYRLAIDATIKAITFLYFLLDSNG